MANVSAVTINCDCIIGGFSVLVGNHFGSSRRDKIFSVSRSVRVFGRRHLRCVSSSLESSFSRGSSVTDAYRGTCYRAGISDNAKCITLTHDYNYGWKIDFHYERTAPERQRTRGKILPRRAPLREIWYNVIQRSVKVPHFEVHVVGFAT